MPTPKGSSAAAQLGLAVLFQQLQGVRRPLSGSWRRDPLGKSPDCRISLDEAHVHLQVVHTCPRPRPASPPPFFFSLLLASRSPDIIAIPSPWTSFVRPFFSRPPSYCKLLVFFSLNNSPSDKVPLPPRSRVFLLNSQAADPNAILTSAATRLSTLPGYAQHDRLLIDSRGIEIDKNPPPYCTLPLLPCPAITRTACP